MLLRSTNHAASLDTTAGPKIGEGARPVVAPRLDGSRRSAGHAAAAAGHSLDARCASKFTRDDHQHPFVQTASVNVFDQSRDRLVKIGRAEFERVENVVIDGVIVPICDPAAQWTVKSRGDDFHTGFDQSASHQTLLTPLVAAVEVTNAFRLASQIESLARPGWSKGSTPVPQNRRWPAWFPTDRRPDPDG